MNKKILAIGVVMIIVGVAMFIGGAEYFDSSFTSSSSSHYTLNQTSNLFISNNITVKSGYIVMIEGASTNSGLVLHSNLSLVANSTALKSHEVKATDSDDGIEMFMELKSGTYNYIYANATKSTAPAYGYITGSQFDLMAGLVIAGVLIGLIGFIVMIYGAIKKEKPKNPYAADDPYNIDNLQI
jgi:uncharacterized membrane protein